MPADYRSSYTPENIRDLWQTPRWLFEAINKRYKFTCDIAASLENHLVDTFLTEEDNALTYDFSGFEGKYLWCNPPYSDITPWVELAIRNRNEFKAGTVLLIPADTSVKWFGRCVDEADEIVFITEGRISFVRADTGDAISGNTKGSMLVLFNTVKNRQGLQTFYVDRDYLKSEGTENGQI